MLTCADLYNELSDADTHFYSWNVGESKAITMEYDQNFFIFMDGREIETTAEEKTILAHEGGHVMTGATHTVYSPLDIVEKHEVKADKWAIQRVIPESDLQHAIALGYTELPELAEYFDVTEEFMRKAVCWYRNGNLDVEHYF